MKIGIQLFLFSLSCACAFAEKHLGFFGDVETLSTGLHFLTSPMVDDPGKFSTRTFDSTFTWDEETGALISSEAVPMSEIASSDLYYDWEEEELFAYIDNDSTLNLLRRDTGELLNSHTFENRVVYGIRPIPNRALLTFEARPARPEPGSNPSFEPASNAYHLIEPANGEIIQSFDQKNLNQVFFLPIGDEKRILALNTGPIASYGTNPILPDATEIFSTIIGVRIIDGLTGSDEIEPILRQDTSSFNGAVIWDRESNELFAIVQQDTIHKINLIDLTVSEYPIDIMSNIVTLTQSGETLIGLFINSGNFEQSSLIATLDAKTLTLGSTIDALENALVSTITAVLPIPDTTQCLLANRKGRIELWDYTQPSFIQSIGSADERIRRWHLSPDGSKLLAHTFSGDLERISVWNIESGSLIFEQSSSSNVLFLSLVDFTSDSEKILSYDENGKIVATHLSTGEIAYRIPESLNKAIACGYYDGGSMKMIVYSEGIVQKIDTENNVFSFQLEDAQILPHQIDPQNGYFLYQSGNLLKYYDPETNVVTPLWEGSDTEMPQTARLTPDASILLLFWGPSNSFSTYIPNIPDFPIIPVSPNPSQPNRVLLIDLQDSNSTLFEDTESSIDSIALSPNGSHFAIGKSNPYRIDIHKTDTGLLDREFGWTNLIDDIAFTSDDAYLYALSNSRLHRLDASTGTILNSHVVENDPFPQFLRLNHILISPNEKLIAISDSRFSFRIFQLPEYSEVYFNIQNQVLSVPRGDAGFSFSPNGGHFMSIDLYSNTREWRSREGTPIEGTLARSPKSNPIFSFLKNPGSNYLLEISNNLTEWRYSQLTIDDRVSLPGFPFPTLPSDEDSIFSRIIEFPEPE